MHERRVNKPEGFNELLFILLVKETVSNKKFCTLTQKDNSSILSEIMQLTDEPNKDAEDPYEMTRNTADRLIEWAKKNLKDEVYIAGSSANKLLQAIALAKGDNSASLRKIRDDIFLSPEREKAFNELFFTLVIKEIVVDDKKDYWQQPGHSNVKFDHFKDVVARKMERNVEKLPADRASLADDLISIAAVELKDTPTNTPAFKLYDALVHAKSDNNEGLRAIQKDIRQWQASKENVPAANRK
jgi:hypothetical protein